MPTEIFYPGVYVEEPPGGFHEIPGVPTSTAAFLGYSKNGRFNVPVPISSFTDFEREFGGDDENGDLKDGVALFFENGGRDAFVVRVGAEGSPPLASDFAGSEAERTGLFALDSLASLNILAAPGQSNPDVHAALAAYALRRRAFAILDLAPSADTPVEAQQWLVDNQLAGCPNAAAYFPRLLIPDPTGISRAIPNSGAIAGVFARTDLNRGVWHAPAGVEAVISGTNGLAYQLQENEAADLNSLGLNGLRTFDSRQVVWGARTLAGADALGSEWKYVPVRRFALFIEESIDRGIRWAAFEPNNENLWAKVRLNVGAFLHILFQQGALLGTKPDEAYYVRCDAATMTPEDIEAGLLNIVIGFAPLRPAEFIIIEYRGRAQPPGGG